MAGLSAAGQLLDYLYPACLFSTFVSVFLFDWMTLRTATGKEKAARGQRTALTLTFVVFLTYAGQVITNLVQALQHRAWAIPEHRIIGNLGDMYVWGVLCGALATFDLPVWDPFVAAWLLAFAFEITICAVGAPRVDGWAAFDVLRVALQGLRILAISALMINMLRIRYRTKIVDLEGESAPLLASNADGVATENDYGTINTPQEEGGSPEDPDKAVKESQKKRLESHGGWVGYLKEFKIFIPYLIPAKNRKVQLCVVIIIINLLLNRFVNVMVPRQIGIITDELAKDYTVMPWKAVLTWVLFRWANSFASFGLVSEIARTHLHNWSSSQIKQLAFHHVMSLSMDFHSNKDSGELIKSIGQADSMNDLLETIFFQIVPVLLDVFIACVYITHLFDGAMAIVFVMIGTMFIWSNVVSTAKVRPVRRVYTEKDRAESKKMYECVSNWPTISYFNRTSHEEELYRLAVKEEMDAQLRYYILSSLGYAVQYLIVYTGLLTVSMMAIFQISEGRKPIGNFVTLVMYWSTLMSPLHVITYQYRRISGATVDAERLLQLLQTEPTVKNHPNAGSLEVKEGEVTFKHVGFSYDERKDTLKDLNFTVQPGQTVAFVGETGGGKSTILKLLFRFYDVKTGGIFIDGQDLRDVKLESLRQELGVVPQDPSLFNQSIMENVRYAHLEAKDEDVIEACKAAAVHDKIMSFPDKYGSKVGERGVKLSGGELQRIAIARVILKNPKIVLLDEATSAVDSSIEAQIQAAFKKLSTGRTTFVVAHRLSTIMEADIILVIDHGEIIERGTHQELLLQGKKYFELWSKQTAAKSSKRTSPTSSILDMPDDITPANRADLSSATTTSKAQVALIDVDSSPVSDLAQVDGACGSKAADHADEAGCCDLKPRKEKSREDENGSSSSSDHGQGDQIQMISARPTFKTAESIVNGADSTSRHISKGSRWGSSETTDDIPCSMVVRPPSYASDSMTGKQPAIAIPVSSASSTDSGKQATTKPEPYRRPNISYSPKTVDSVNVPSNATSQSLSSSSSVLSIGRSNGVKPPYAGIERAPASHDQAGSSIYSVEDVSNGDTEPKVQDIPSLRVLAAGSGSSRDPQAAASSQAPTTASQSRHNSLKGGDESRKDDASTDEFDTATEE